jgi:hypothetical protein
MPCVPAARFHGLSSCLSSSRLRVWPILHDSSEGFRLQWGHKNLDVRLLYVTGRGRARKRNLCDGGLTVERLLCRIDDISHFSVRDVEKYSPRSDGIRTLTLEVGSRMQSGSYSLVLIKPFPPFGRPGAELDALRSLPKEDIDSIWGFCRADNGPGARIEIYGKAHRPIMFVTCERIEGVPGWDQESGDATVSSGPK